MIFVCVCLGSPCSFILFHNTVFALGILCQEINENKSVCYVMLFFFLQINQLSECLHTCPNRNQIAFIGLGPVCMTLNWWWIGVKKNNKKKKNFVDPLPLPLTRLPVLRNKLSEILLLKNTLYEWNKNKKKTSEDDANDNHPSRWTILFCCSLKKIYGIS